MTESHFRMLTGGTDYMLRPTQRPRQRGRRSRSWPARGGRTRPASDIDTAAALVGLFATAFTGRQIDVAADDAYRPRRPARNAARLDALVRSGDGQRLQGH